MICKEEGSPAADTSSRIKQTFSDPKRSQAMSVAFASMCRAIISLLEGTVDADELKDFLRYLVDPQSPDQLFVDPSIYKGATTTKEVLECLCPRYVNPTELFILEGIVETFGSDQCKKHLEDYKIEVAIICDDKKGKGSDLCESEQSKAAPPSCKKASINRSRSCEHR